MGNQKEIARVIAASIRNYNVSKKYGAALFGLLAGIELCGHKVANFNVPVTGKIAEFVLDGVRYDVYERKAAL